MTIVELIEVFQNRNSLYETYNTLYRKADLNDLEIQQIILLRDQIAELHTKAFPSLVRFAQFLKIPIKVVFDTFVNLEANLHGDDLVISDWRYEVNVKIPNNQDF